MSNIEKLTEEGRAKLAWPMPHRAEATTLRIINTLTEALAAENERLRALHEQALNERDAAHNGLEEWKRLRDEAYALYRSEGDKREAAESRLATAEGLIQEVWDNGDIPRKIGLKLKAFLAAQPAAPTRTEAEPRGHHCGVSGWRPDLGDEPCPACERNHAAYLARRGLK